MTDPLGKTVKETGDELIIPNIYTILINIICKFLIRNGKSTMESNSHDKS